MRAAIVVTVICVLAVLCFPLVMHACMTPHAAFNAMMLAPLFGTVMLSEDSGLKEMMRAKRAQMWRNKVDRMIAEALTPSTFWKRGISGGSPAAVAQASPAALNLAQRQAVLSNSVEMTQQIFSQFYAALGAGANVINIQPRNVGLIKKFIIEISGTYTSTGAAAATAFGLCNLLSQVIFTDLNNNQRINTSGIHLAILKQVKHRTSDPSSAPVTTAQSDAMVAGEFAAGGAAPNFGVIVYPLPSTAAASFRAVFEVPLAYSDDDLRGAIYANIVNATMNLQLTINPTPSPASTDNTFSVWGTATGPLSNVTIAVYQVYLDQLPVGKNGVILPMLDLSTVYELKTTQFTAISANTDYPVPYANFRDFLSTLAIFNSTGATAGLKAGSDVNYWALQSANFTNLWKIDPLLAAQKTREIIGSDLPLGTYYFSHRRKPISTTQYGNMELILNAASVSGSPYLQVCWEDFALVNTLSQAGSLAG